MSIELKRISGDDLAAHLPALADLRIRVFAEYPYLYDGEMDYEESYLAEFAAEPGSVLIAAFESAAVVGAATCSPMAGQKAAFQAPFRERGHDINQLFYFGESVLLPAYRGRGIGRAFFELREQAARQAGATHATFCAVVRPADHPARPKDYRPLDAFWRSRGYGPADGLTTIFDWAEHGGTVEVPHEMQFWIGAL